MCGVTPAGGCVSQVPGTVATNNRKGKDARGHVSEHRAVSAVRELLEDRFARQLRQRSIRPGLGGVNPSGHCVSSS